MDGARNDDADPFTDFTGWQASDFTDKNGWHLDYPPGGTDMMNLVNVATTITKYPLMMMMHYGAQDYMGGHPDSDEYAEYVLAVVYYLNVCKGMNVKYWEILNEPDWQAWNGEKCPPEEYAAIFRRVATRIKNHPDPRVNSIRLGGPVSGSGDPIDGDYPTGYPNKVRDDNRWMGQYLPALLETGSRPGKQDIGFLSWHDYADGTWGPNVKQPYHLHNNYAFYNRVLAHDALADAYVASGGQRPPIVISEMNFDAGGTVAEGKERYKNFYACLWHTSTLNNYLATRRTNIVFHFFWRGTNH